MPPWAWWGPPPPWWEKCGSSRRRRGDKGGGAGLEEGEEGEDDGVLPSTLKNPPKWKKGLSYREYREVLSSWTDRVKGHINPSPYGPLPMQTSDSDRIVKCTLRAQSDGFLADWDYVLKLVDEEFKWSDMGEGIIRHRQYRRGQKSPGTQMDGHLQSHEDSFKKMRDLLFPKRNCRCGAPIEAYPEVMRTYGLVDSCGLDDRQGDLLRGLTMDGEGAPRGYKVVKAKLKGLFGREAKAIAGTGTGRGDAIKEASSSSSSSTPQQQQALEASSHQHHEEQATTWWDEDGNEYWKGPGDETIFTATRDPKGKKKWKPFLRPKGKGAGKGGKPWAGGKKGGGAAGGAGKAAGDGKGKPSGGYNPSAQNPCNKCGSPDHWARECPTLIVEELDGPPDSANVASTGLAAVAVAAAVGASSIPGAGATSTTREAHFREPAATASSSSSRSPPVFHEGRNKAKGKQAPVPEEVLSGGVYSREDPGEGLREATSDCGATAPVMGFDTYKKHWTHPPAGCPDQRRPRTTWSTRRFSFGDGRIQHALFKAWLPVVMQGYLGWLGTHITKGKLPLLFADPLLAESRGSLSYEEYKRLGAPTLHLDAPGRKDVRLRVPLRRSAAGHWAFSLCSPSTATHDTHGRAFQQGESGPRGARRAKTEFGNWIGVTDEACAATCSSSTAPASSSVLAAEEASSAAQSSSGAGKDEELGGVPDVGGGRQNTTVRMEGLLGRLGKQLGAFAMLLSAAAADGSPCAVSTTAAVGLLGSEGMCASGLGPAAVALGAGLPEMSDDFPFVQAADASCADTFSESTVNQYTDYGMIHKYDAPGDIPTGMLSAAECLNAAGTSLLSIPKTQLFSMGNVHNLPSRTPGECWGLDEGGDAGHFLEAISSGNLSHHVHHATTALPALRTRCFYRCLPGSMISRRPPSSRL